MLISNDVLKRVGGFRVHAESTQSYETANAYLQIAKSKDPKQVYGVKINPNKPEKVSLTAEDRIIVLAED